MREAEYITIGKYYLEIAEDGTLWIEPTNAGGEGGTFSESSLEDVIDTFYKEHF